MSPSLAECAAQGIVPEPGELKAKLLTIRDMPTLPNVLDEVSKLVESPDTNTREIAKLISLDQVLSAKVLKMVNSPIYGFPGRISTINHALVLLGFNVIRGIVISTSVLDIMAKSMAGLWHHSVTCALASGIIAREVGKEEPEEYSVAGLLHDLGKLAMELQLPELSAQVVKCMQTEDLPRLEAEKAILGVGHDKVNGWLAELWNLPPNLTEGLTCHHNPAKAEHYQDLACVVHVADFMTYFVGRGDGDETGVPYLQPMALEKLGLDVGVLPLLLSRLEAKLPKDGSLPL